MIAAEIFVPVMSLTDYNKRIKWCKKKIGKMAEFRDQVDDDRPWTSQDAGYARGYTWYFAREEYAVLFVLKWS
jgi:hypothetical protein